MAIRNETPATAPGSPTVTDLMTGAAQRSLREGVHEMRRAEGHRGMVTLTVVLNLGDHGVPTWIKSSVHFEEYLHHKDAARENPDGQVD